MKSIVFLIGPGRHSFAEGVYFQNIASYLKQNGTRTKFLESIDEVQSSLVIAAGQDWTSDVILKAKDRNNTLVSFDVNDNTQLTDTYRDKEEAYLLDYIFKAGGVQLQDSEDLYINQNLDLEAKLRPFYISDKTTEIYNHFVMSNKISPLPHVPNNNVSYSENVPFEKRKQLALVRGGHHFQRFMMYLALLSINRVDSNSVFFTGMYAHQFCENCKAVGRVTLDNYKSIKCGNPCSPWQDDGESGDFLNKNWMSWNNRCVPMFMWLADKFDAEYGINREMLNNALNGDHAPGFKGLAPILSSYLFYADYKWIYSIYVPPRFWEAASCRTLNLQPMRTGHQLSFPEIEEGKHYVGFKEDFSDLGEVCGSITKEKYEYISHNAHELYKEWIAPGLTRLSDNLIKRILEKLEEL